MAESDTTSESEKPGGKPLQGEVPRRVPALISYMHPFRLVSAPALSPWSATIDMVNRGTWDYVQLHEIVSNIDVGLAPPYHLVVARDGALALPPIPSLRGDQAAVEFFNRCLAALLLGGVYCEAITLDNLELGSIIDWKYVRSHGAARGAPNRLHELFRRRMAPPLEAIQLLNPRTIVASELEVAMAKGRSVLASIPEMSPEFLLKGTSGMARRDWGTALANLWIVIEQLTEHLWEKHVIEPEKRAEERIEGRKDQLADTRTWTAAARHELLHQLAVLTVGTFQNLSIARKARNELSHRGKHPDVKSARAAYEGCKTLIDTICQSPQLPFLTLNVSDHALSDPFSPRDHEPLNPLYWMEILKLPGEAELEREEASRDV